VEEQIQNNSQPSQEGGLKILSVTDPEKEAQMAPQTSGEAKPLETIVDEKQALLDQITQLEQKLQAAPTEPVVKVEYMVPDELRQLVDNPATIAILNENYAAKPVDVLLKEQFKRDNPWATTDSMVENALRRQYPDIDFEIPENLGLSDVEFAEISWKAEGFRKQQMDEQTALKGKIEEAMKIPEPAQFDNAAFEQEYAQRVEHGLGSVKPMELALDIPGYEFPKLDMAKVKELAYSENAPLMVDPQTGLVWPKMDAIAALAELEHLKAQIPAMLEAARRAAPKEAVAAINQTLNNQAPMANTAPASVTGQQANNGPRIGGFRVMGVQSNF
jgi:hypothetical protein